MVYIYELIGFTTYFYTVYSDDQLQFIHLNTLLEYFKTYKTHAIMKQNNY